MSLSYSLKEEIYGEINRRRSLASNSLFCRFALSLFLSFYVTVFLLCHSLILFFCPWLTCLFCPFVTYLCRWRGGNPAVGSEVMWRDLGSLMTEDRWRKRSSDRRPEMLGKERLISHDLVVRSGWNFDDKLISPLTGRDREVIDFTWSCVKNKA